jgi:hypothetical protein
MEKTLQEAALDCNSVGLKMSQPSPGMKQFFRDSEWFLLQRDALRKALSFNDKCSESL